MATKHAVVTQIAGTSLAARSDSNHWVVMDSAEEFGGSNAGSRPKELILMALGGCTANDVINILRKKRAPVDNVEVRLTGEEAEEHPRVFTKIHIEYVVRGENVRAADVERAIELSVTKYCSVSAMLAPVVTLTHSYRIETPAVAA